MNRKAKHRAIVVRALDRALGAVYHNATLGAFPDVPKGYNDGAWESLQFYYSDMLDDINAGRYGDLTYIEGYIASRYGLVSTYGRGGRTCAPSGWMMSESRCYVKQADDFIAQDGASYGYLVRLLMDVLAWNTFVRDTCSKENIAEVINPWLEDVLDEVQQRKGAFARLCLL